LPFYNIPFFKTPFHLSKEMVLQGPVRANTGGRIDGTVNGEVNVQGLLVIGKSAEVRGNVHATKLEVLGSVHGNIFCDDKAIIYNTAFVKGDVTAMVIEVKEGAMIEGVIIKKASKEAEKAAEMMAEQLLLDAANSEPPPPEEEPVIEKSTDKDKDSITWF
jgi:cytoskeletal protein CcmA (bactofilin family)